MPTLHSTSTRPRRQLALLGALAVGGLLALPADAQTFSAVADFPSGSNPSGNWSLGYSSSLGGAFTLHASHDSNWNGTGLEAWSTDLGSGVPLAVKNASGVPVNFLTITLPNNTLDLHPGNGFFQVMRFTSPASANYQVAGMFMGIDVGPTTTDVHVLRNGVSFFDDTIASMGIPTSFNQTVTLALGDHLDFAVGPNGTYFNDSTGLQGTVTFVSPVPEPAEIGVLAALGLGAFAARRSRRMGAAAAAFRTRRVGS